jgi:hypothetical protein
MGVQPTRRRAPRLCTTSTRAGGRGHVGGVLRLGAWKVIAKRLIQATWFGAFSPEAPANISAAQTRVKAALAEVGRFRRRRALQMEARALDDEARALQRAAQFAHACSHVRPCLFNVADDPTEQHDLAEQHPARVETLREHLDRRHREFHLGPVARGNETATEQVARWRSGWCGAALAHRGFSRHAAAQPRTRTRSRAHLVAKDTDRRCRTDLAARRCASLATVAPWKLLTDPARRPYVRGTLARGVLGKDW